MTEAGAPLERSVGAGRYVVRLTEAGDGASRFDRWAVTSGGEYPEREGGVRLYVRDLDSGAWWAAGRPPSGRAPDGFTARLGAEPPRLERVDGDVVTTLELEVPEDGAAELRRLTVRNGGDTAHRLEVTSYVPLALDLPGAYAAHPAFSKLFIQTRYLPELEGLIARRRPRSPTDPAVSAVHLLVPGDGFEAEGGTSAPSYETDRARFVGRGRTALGPLALESTTPLSGTVGNVLDPVLALRREVRLEPGSSAEIVAVLAAGSSADAALEAIRPYAGGSGHGAGVPGPASGSAAPANPAANPAASPWSRPMPDGGRGLRYFNGIGGFSESGDEYVIRVEDGRRPPLPWINVVANPDVGFLVSESGAGYTWAGNSRLNRLTPWHNDPVSDPHGEAVYLRDEDDGAFWTPTPGPVPDADPYETRHGLGYTRFHHESRGLAQDMWTFVAPADPVKLIRLRVANRTDRPRRLAAYAYAEWVLGGGAASRLTVRAEPDAARGRVLARNPATADFGDRVAFAAGVGPGGVGVTADRSAFLGTPGLMSDPAAVREGASFEPAAGAGDDACAAFRIALDVPAGAAAECAFVLGQAASEEEVAELLDRYGTIDTVVAAQEEAEAGWRDRVGGVRIQTPSPALDLMVNGWLPYQDLSCRIWGRSAFYQSGGAFGYRDQLQDVTGLIYLDPGMARDQILLHAAHQFPEGDVLHWWHPPASRGIRTRFSDDLLWLPYVTGFYLDVTGDASVLDERTRFVLGRELEPGEDEAYMEPAVSTDDADVYTHACLAIDRSLTRGAHGLPLIGTGDWNDGMNRVGREGRGESVWLGFFLASVLDRWIPICRDRGDDPRADRYAVYRERLHGALNDAGWDGGWYRRAFYDSGAPIGSAGSDECRIDAIAQAWAVLSRVAPADRAERALDALEAHLVSEDDGLIRLLTPPFDETPRDPGYIKGYIPGVRENGGQYTHGVLWAVRAMAEAGRSERAAALLEMLLPVNHGRTPEEVERYRVEPYVVAADVYGADPHVGRGGWTWYTGSAGWMYRIALESVLGIEIRDGRRLRVRPCIPASWPGYRLEYRVPGTATRYAIEVTRTDAGAATRAQLDGEELEVRGGVPAIELANDGKTHRLRVELGPDCARRYEPASFAEASASGGGGASAERTATG